MATVHFSGSILLFFYYVSFSELHGIAVLVGHSSAMAKAFLKWGGGGEQKQ